MAHSHWPARAAAGYLILTVLSWVIAFGADWQWGLERLILILGLPWSLLLADSSGTGLDLFLIFSCGVLNAMLLYVGPRLLSRLVSREKAAA